MANGKFIVFEGIEGCGKSYQINKLYEILRKNSENVILTREQWEEDEIGKLIKRELVDKKDGINILTLQLLFVANRSNHVDKLILPSIKEGKTVLSDRYWMTNAAYGGAHYKEEKINMDYFMRVNEVFHKPDLVVYIDIDAETAMERIRFRQSKSYPNTSDDKKQAERFDKLDVLRELRNGYLSLAEKYDGNWVTINGNQERENVTKDVMDAITKIGIDLNGSTG